MHKTISLLKFRPFPTIHNPIESKKTAKQIIEQDLWWTISKLSITKHILTTTVFWETNLYNYWHNFKEVCLSKGKAKWVFKFHFDKNMMDVKIAFKIKLYHQTIESESATMQKEFKTVVFNLWSMDPWGAVIWSQRGFVKAWINVMI